MQIGKKEALSASSRTAGSRRLASMISFRSVPLNAGGIIAGLAGRFVVGPKDVGDI